MRGTTKTGNLPSQAPSTCLRRASAARKCNSPSTAQAHGAPVRRVCDHPPPSFLPQPRPVGYCCRACHACIVNGCAPSCLEQAIYAAASDGTETSIARVASPAHRPRLVVRMFPLSPALILSLHQSLVAVVIACLLLQWPRLFRRIASVIPPTRLKDPTFDFSIITIKLLLHNLPFYSFQTRRVRSAS